MKQALPIDRLLLSASLSALLWAMPVAVLKAQEADTVLRPGFDASVDGTITMPDDGRDIRRRRREPAEDAVIFEPLPDDDAVDGADARINPAAATPPDRSYVNDPETSVLRQSPVGTPDDNGELNPRGNLATSPVETGNAVAESDPYAAIGIRIGTFDLFPTLELNGGYTTNADFAQNGSKAAFSETTAGLRLQSNWALHSFQAELGATYQRFFSGNADNLPTANANATLRLDLRREYTLTLRGAYDFATESLTSTNLTTGGVATITERPGIHGLVASAEIAKTAGRLRFSLRGSLDKTLHEDAKLSTGGVLGQADRDNLLATVTGRLSYQATPVIAPFVEASVGKRIYDLKVDSNGNRRDSNVYALRGGLELNFGEKLNGQFGVGYAVENFTDPAINKIGAVTLDGSINWSPVRLTTVTATASTTLSPSANINDNGSVIYSGNLGISRLVSPELTLDANLTASLQDYDTTGRRDVTLGANAGYTYWFNRFVAATGRVSYQNVESTAAGSSYDVGTIRLGLRFQR